MLSYRHSFHAGNFADLLKHAVLVEILDYLSQKESPFEYVDTHSGAGLFNLDSTDANKLQEYKTGIARLERDHFIELTRYFEIIDSYNKSNTLMFYPGSPAIASCFLRRQDRAWLCELHPQDHKLLQANMAKYKKVRVFCDDGLKKLQSFVPLTSRRGLVLIDPSYEIKSEYEQVFFAIKKAYKKFSTGIYALWYPVVDRSKIDLLERRFIKSGIKNIQRFELGVAQDSPERGMTASGMIVINPPWTLFDTMSALLPKMASVVGDTNKGCYKCDVLVGE